MFSGLFCIDPVPCNDRPVLLIHGLGADARTWLYQIEALKAACMRPMAVDLPGFGRSPHGGGKWSINRSAQVVWDWLTSSHLEVVDIVGLSMGGAVALQMVLDQPQRVRKLVLANTFACLRPSKPGDWFYLLRRFLVANLRGSAAQAEMVAKRIFPHEEQALYRHELVERIQQADPEVYKMAMRSIGLFDVRRRLKEIRMPVLVISAADDTTVAPDIQGNLAAAIPGAQQVVIPQARHAVIIDQPELFNRYMIDFLLDGTFKD